jgi:hypothetical protein
VWHPQDAGEPVAAALIDHFHGDAFSGLIGGAIEVFNRSEGWASPEDAPRPLPFVRPLPHGLDEAAYTVVVPVMGLELAAAVEAGRGPWHQYAQLISQARDTAPDRVGVIPIVLPGAPPAGALAHLFGGIQGVRYGSEDLCRDIAQGIAQFVVGSASVLRVFVSHTKHAVDGSAHMQELLDQIRHEIANTRLDEFFDAHDLHVGRDWAPDLIEGAATSALLAVRTDLFATREWCQREVLTAKRAGMPVVILDALASGEDRGSFLMDHVPRVPRGKHLDAAIATALGRLVDECLKRALWQRQRELAEHAGVPEVAWWAPHAPEPTTMLDWLLQAGPAIEGDSPVLVLHPDPPLGQQELGVLAELAQLAGLDSRVEILTPRGLATRGS